MAEKKMTYIDLPISDHRITQCVKIGNKITIVALKNSRSEQVSIGITAPREMPIVRPDCVKKTP